MSKKLMWGMMAVLPLGLSGLLAASVANNATSTDDNLRAGAETAYVCPLTGEELPCPKCCPLNKE